MTQTTGEAVTIVSHGIQSLIEAAQTVEALLPASGRDQFAMSLTRARQARIALAEWAEEMR